MFSYKSRKFLIKKEKVRLPNKKIVEIEVLIKKAGVSVLPFTNSGEVILAYQYRPYIKKWIYELPGGKIERGETPKQAANRELREELGYTADSIEFMAKSYTTPYFSTDSPYIFLARGLHKKRMAREDDEVISIKRLKLEKAMQLVDEGKIEDLGTATALLILWRKIHLERHK